MTFELSDEDIERIADAVARRLAPPKPPVSIPRAARQLGISARTVSRLSSRGLLQTIKLGSRTVVPSAEIDRLLADKDLL